MHAAIFVAIINAAPPNVLARFECHRCHEGTGLEELPLEKRCVGCHRAIVRGKFEQAKPETVKRWQRNIVDLTAAPSLQGAKKLKREWIEKFLQKPHDLRPALSATMPRLPIDAQTAKEIAQELAPEDPAQIDLDPDDITKGKKLFDDLKCITCHDAKAIDPPDLRYTRDRMTAATLIAFLRSPAAFDPASKMPSFELDEPSARQLAAFLMFAPLAPPADTAPRSRLPLLTRVVRFDEVSRRVLKKVCWHCHSSPDYARGDGGPGNSGGFGYRGRGLDFSSYQGIANGAIADNGKRQSIFRGDPPKIIEVLLSRVQEERGEMSDVIGMPLGLPSLTSEDIQLVESWIAQGRPE